MFSYFSDKKTPIYITIGSILTALFADVKCVNWGLAKGGFVGEGVMAPLYIGTIGTIIVVSLLANRNCLKNIPKLSILFAISLFLFYYVTLWLVGKPRINFYFFLVFTISAYFIPQMALVHTRTFLRYVMFLPSFSILNINRIFASYLTWMDVISMDASYGYLVPIIANIVYVLTYYSNENKKHKIITLVISFINFVFFIQLLLYGSRGPLLAILLLFIFIYVVKKREGLGIYIHVKRMWRMVVLSFFLIFALPQMASVLDDTLSSMGYHSYALQKIVRLDETGNQSNGRGGLVEKTISEIPDNLLFGHGFDRFEANHPGLPYPHNFVLQILYDGGLIFFVVIFSLLFYKGRKLLKRCTKDEYIMFIFLFFSSVPGALFSQDMWQISILWMFFGYVSSRRFIYQNNGKNARILTLLDKRKIGGSRENVVLN